MANKTKICEKKKLQVFGTYNPYSESVTVFQSLKVVGHSNNAVLRLMAQCTKTEILKSQIQYIQYLIDDDAHRIRMQHTISHVLSFFLSFFFLLSFFLNGKLETLCIAFIFWLQSACLYVCIISMVYSEFLYFIITCYVSSMVFLCEFWGYRLKVKTTLNGNSIMCIIS